MKESSPQGIDPLRTGPSSSAGLWYVPGSPLGGECSLVTSKSASLGKQPLAYHTNLILVVGRLSKVKTQLPEPCMYFLSQQYPV